VWAGAALAARLAGHPFGATLADAGRALVGLGAHPGEPAAAWPEPVREALPGPFLYWGCQVVVLVVAAGVAVAAWRLLRSGPERDGLGVERSARFGTRRDIARLRVKGPTPGRIILGTAAGALVATEERTSVCVVGPSQSHKTSGLCIPALLELGPGEGAVIAASVKGDVLADTRRRREGLGEVKVFDPTCVVVTDSATWSPLRSAGTVTGAQSAARAMVDVAGAGGIERADFWMQAAKELLWPLLFTAARAGLSMADVVGWVMTQDRPRYVGGQLVSAGEVSGWLEELWAKARGEEAAREVTLAFDALCGVRAVV